MPARPDRGLPVVSPRGDFDLYNAASLTIELLDAAEGPGGVILDASGISFADSSVLRALLDVHRNTCLRIAALPAHLARTLAIIGLDRVLSLYPTVAEAQQGFPA